MNLKKLKQLTLTELDQKNLILYHQYQNLINLEFLKNITNRSLLYFAYRDIKHELEWKNLLA